jgi:hypothetical protein
MSFVVVDAPTGSPGIATGLNLARNVLRSKFRALGQRMTAAGDAQRSGEVLRLLGGQDQTAVQASVDQLAQRRDFLRRANAISAPSLIGGLAAGRVAGGLLAGPDDPQRPRGLLD